MLEKSTINLHTVEKLVHNLTFLYIFYLLAELLSKVLNISDNIFNFVNWFGPLVFLFICCLSCYQLLKDNFIILFTPFFFYLVFSAINFGFGPLIFTFGDSESIEYINLPYQPSSYELYRTNLLNIIGTLATCIPFAIVIKKFKFIILNKRLQQRNHDSEATFAALAFLIVGFTVKYLILLPNLYSSSRITIPVVFSQLGELTSVSLLLLSYLFFSGKGKKYLVILVLVSLPELLTGLLSFSKLSFLTTPMCILIGYVMAKPKLKITLLALIIISIAYLWILPFVNWGRTQTSEIGSNSFNQNLAILIKYLENQEEISNTEDLKQGWWIRLYLANFQAYAMNEYDKGQPSDNISKYFLWTFIPRFVYPDKPIITNAGIEFSMRVMGTSTTSTGVSTFGDAYFNGGWGMVVLTAAIIGVLLAIATRLVLITVKNRAFVFLPLVLLGIINARAIETRFVEVFSGLIIGVILNFIVLYFIFYKLRRKH
ncbi:MAG: hypothetical protein U1F76_14860 [Candidatus Competibacteraceae bacterium]